MGNDEGHTDRGRCALRAFSLPSDGVRLTVNGYLQAGSPSPAVVTTVFVVFTPMPQVKFGIWLCVTVADQ